MHDLEALEARALEMITAAGYKPNRRVGLEGLLVDIAFNALEPTSEPTRVGIMTRNWAPADWRTVAPIAGRDAKFREGAWEALHYRALVPGSGSAPLPLMTLDDLGALLARLSPPRTSRGTTNPTLRPTVFCAMPFHEDFLDVFYLAIDPALRRLEYDVNRLDQTHSFKGIDRRIREGIAGAAFVLADISGRNPNVMYEVGLAHGMGRDTFLLVESVTDIPFDVRDQMVLPYDRKKLHPLAGQLQERVAQAVGGRHLAAGSPEAAS